MTKHNYKDKVIIINGGSDILGGAKAKGLAFRRPQDRYLRKKNQID